MASSKRHEAVKVVFIDTQYIVTDSLSFKSVVQNLTGKDPCVSRVEESSFDTGVKRKRETDQFTNNAAGLDSYNSTNKGNYGFPVGGDGHGGSDCWKLSKGLSFKDLDRMILEMPPMEEWYQLLSQSNLL